MTTFEVQGITLMDDMVSVQPEIFIVSCIDGGPCDR